MTVLVDEDSLKEYLSDYGCRDEEEIEEMTRDELQSESLECVQGILSNELSDFMVIDKNSLVYGDVEVYEPAPNNLNYIFRGI
jgi:hypothetical protein